MDPTPHIQITGLSPFWAMIGALGIVAGSLVSIWGFLKLTRKEVSTAFAHAVETTPSVVELKAHVSEIRTALSPNGGFSLADKIENTNRTVMEVARNQHTMDSRIRKLEKKKEA